jgi:hypothetical protein
MLLLTGGTAFALRATLRRAAKGAARATLAAGSREDARASHRRRRRAHRGRAATRRLRIPQAECARAPARRGSAFLGRDAWRRPRAARRHASPGASRGRRSRSAALEPIVVAGHPHIPPELPPSATGQEPHSQPGWVARGGQRPSAQSDRSELSWSTWMRRTRSSWARADDQQPVQALGLPGQAGTFL